MHAIITAFALVLAVVACGAVALTISALAQLKRATESQLGTLRNSLASVQAIAAKSSSTTLRTEVDDLRGALDVMRASHRREMASLWGRMGGRPRQTSMLDGDTGEPLTGDDELAAMVALQTAKPVSPNGSR